MPVRCVCKCVWECVCFYAFACKVRKRTQSYTSTLTWFTHTRIKTHTHTDTSTHTHTYIHVYTHVHLHTRAQTHARKDRNLLQEVCDWETEVNEVNSVRADSQSELHFKNRKTEKESACTAHEREWGCEREQEQGQQCERASTCTRETVQRESKRT